jgi:hypothetical protein
MLGMRRQRPREGSNKQAGGFNLAPDKKQKRADDDGGLPVRLRNGALQSGGLPAAW